MKQKHSQLDRRRFLDLSLLGGFGALLSSFIYPVIRFIRPPRKEPDRMLIPLTEIAGLAANEAWRFPWGSRPGILVKKENGEYRAFVGLCTHLDCNVDYIPDKKRFFCACHEGWFDEEGINVAGPPPRPLRRLGVRIEGDEMVVEKRDTDAS